MNIPEGYVLVPINATSAMIEYGKDERMQCLANPSLSVQGALVRIYSAMIGAAPFVCESNVEEYDEAKERELFEVSHPVPEFVKWDDEFNHYLVNLYPGECDSEYGSLWDGWKACAQSRSLSAE